MSYWLHMDEGVLDVPPGFRDMSVQILEWKTPDGNAIGLTVQREELDDAVDLDAYVTRTTGAYERELPGFKLDDRRPLEHIAAPGRLLVYRWAAEGQVCCQVQAFVQIGRRLLLTTATAPASHRQQAEAVVLRSVGSFRVREH